MRRSSSTTGEPWCAPTREVENAELMQLARKTKRTTGPFPVKKAAHDKSQAGYQLATLEDRELADGSTPDLVDPFQTPSRVTTVVVPTPEGARGPEQGKTWALVLAIVLMLATAAGVVAIVLL